MIFVSAGHHPKAPGACFNGDCEHGEAMVWVSQIANNLGREAMVVPPGTLRDKIAFINSRCTVDDLAMEIHFNSDPAHAGRGSEVLYYPSSTTGKEVAQRVADALSGVFPPGRGAKEGYYRMNPDNGPDYFLARTRCTAIIIEPEFIHNIAVIRRDRGIGCAAITDITI